MDGHRVMLRHFLAAIAYRTQKSLRGAPEGFGGFRVAPGVRTPAELVRHMTSVLGYATTFFVGGAFDATPLATLENEVARLHATLSRLHEHFANGSFERMRPEGFLQGPLADAMTHVGQLAMLRRLYGAPVPPENFIFAEVDSRNVSAEQPDPVAPDEDWHTPDGH
jgi:hypothetical protein